MDYLNLKEEDYSYYFQRIAKEVTLKYKVEVNIGSLLQERTGEFNGKFINIDSHQSDEEKLFLLLHLFGHIVQWSVSPYWRELGLKQPGLEKFEEYRKELLKRLDEIYEYEREASAYGMQLLNDCNIYELDQWLSDWFNADWKFLKKVYQNGFKKEYSENFKEKYFVINSPMILPEKFPNFIPQEWEYRFAF